MIDNLRQVGWSSQVYLDHQKEKERGKVSKYLGQKYLQKWNVTVNKYELVTQNADSTVFSLYTILDLKTGMWGSGQSLIGAILYQRFILPSLCM